MLTMSAILDKIMQENLESAVPSGGDPSLVVPILMPQATNDMAEGIVVAWCVEVGEEVEKGQLLCEIETDKSVVEYEAPESGRMAKLVAGDEDAIEVGEPIAYLAPGDADLDAYLAQLDAGPPEEEAPKEDAEAAVAPIASAPASSSARTTAAASPDSPGQRFPASPAARQIAGERGIDLATLPAGSGPGGRILSTDLAAIHLGAAEARGAIRKPISRMRRAIAARLTTSKQEVPHFYCRSTIDAAPMLRFHAEQRGATGCTLNDVITLACARVIAEMPRFRSQIAGSDLLEFPHADIGIAVGADDGLVVPVILAAEEMDLAELAAEAKRTVLRAREGRVDNMDQGVFTITNLGMFGIDEFTAIINPPEAAILAVSAIREAMIVRDGEALPGKVMSLTLSNDHRIIDGIVGARFMARLRELLEDPDQLLLRS